MCDALVALRLFDRLESPVPETQTTARTVLWQVLGNPQIAFNKPIPGFTSNRSLEALSKPGTPSCVLETRANLKTKENARMVLDPIIHACHENLIDFIGKHCVEPGGGTSAWVVYYVTEIRKFCSSEARGPGSV